MPAVVGGAVLAGPIRTALSGPAYASAAPALRLLLVSIDCIFASLAAHNVLLVLRRMWSEVRVVAAAVVMNIVANMVLIPLYGLNGAAIATVASEGVILGGTAIVMRQLHVHPWRPTLARPLAAAAMMGTMLVMWGRATRSALKCLAASRFTWQQLPYWEAFPGMRSIDNSMWLGRLSASVRPRLGADVA